MHWVFSIVIGVPEALVIAQAMALQIGQPIGPHMYERFFACLHVSL